LTAHHTRTHRGRLAAANEADRIFQNTGVTTTRCRKKVTETIDVTVTVMSLQESTGQLNSW